MKNNYKQLKSPPSLNNKNTFKRSASHALRSSFRMPVKNKRISGQFNALNLDQLPTSIPPKALRLLQIDLPPPSTINNVSDQIRIATIRRKSVWANASASKSLLLWEFFYLRNKS